MQSRVPLSLYADITMGQSPKGDTCSDSVGMPLLNGPTEFASKHPIPTQFTTEPKRQSKVDDILFCVRGSTTGRMNYADQEYAIGRGIASIRGKDGYPTVFVRGLIERNLQQLLNIATGSTFPNVSRDMINSFQVENVSKKDATKIAHILSTLDDKIEINRKMNQTLEEMAQALFRSWFVDFDPVHAKADAKSDEALERAAAELGVSKEVLELFPSEFEESEMGMIPKGWSNDFLSSFVEILDSKRIPMSKSERAKKQGSIPYYGATSIMDYVDDFIFDEPLTLLGEDGSVARDDGTPFMQYIWGKAWVNNHAHVIKSKSTLSTEAIYVALLKQNVTMFVTGAVQPKINQTNLKKIPMINPGDKLHSIYSELIAPMFAKIRQLSDETKTLIKTRDTLLPKLLSGELDVSKVET